MLRMFVKTEGIGEGDGVSVREGVDDSCADAKVAQRMTIKVSENAFVISTGDETLHPFDGGEAASV